MEEKIQQKRNRKYYIVATRCGHCGNGYFVPVLMPVRANSLKEALCVADETPRVKHERKGSIIFGEERSENEYWMVRLLNTIDPFMTESINDATIRERRIVMPEVVEGMQNAKYSGKGLKKYEKQEDIKTSDQYPEYYPLQRYFAPQYVNGKYEFCKNVNFDILLKEYFTETIRRFVIEAVKEGEKLRNLMHIAKENDTLLDEETFEAYKEFRKNRNEYISILVLYCKLYSNTNPLGLKYFPDIHEVAYYNAEERKLRYIKIPQDRSVEHKGSSTENDDPIFAKEEKKAPYDAASLTEGTPNPAKMPPSSIEKFKRRLARHKAMIAPSSGEMGDE